MTSTCYAVKNVFCAAWFLFVDTKYCCCLVNNSLCNSVHIYQDCSLAIINQLCSPILLYMTSIICSSPGFQLLKFFSNTQELRIIASIGRKTVRTHANSTAWVSFFFKIHALLIR